MTCHYLECVIALQMRKTSNSKTKNSIVSQGNGFQAVKIISYAVNTFYMYKRFYKSCLTCYLIDNRTRRQKTSNMGKHLKVEKHIRARDIEAMKPII